MNKSLLTPLAYITLALLIAVTVAGFVLIPAGAVLAVHWDIEGAVDGYLPRDHALVIPLGITALVWGIFLLIGRFASPASQQGGRQAIAVAVPALTTLLAVLQGAVILIGMGVQLEMIKVVSLLIAGLLLVLGNVIPKSQPNSLAGIRIPSTLRDPANWQATHRLAGYLMIAAGAGLAVAAVFVSSSFVVFVTLLVCVLLPIVVSTIYSLRYRRG